MDLLHENGLIFGNSVCYTSKNMDAVTSDEFFDLLIEHGSRFAWYFHLMPVGMKASPELMPTKEQREYIYHRLREVRGFEGGKEIFVMDFQNDGEYVGGCIAGGRNYCHINPKGDVEPCVFIHYSGANIREKSLLECLKQPLFMAYRDNQPFNENMLRPCPMLENPEILQKMVHETGAHSTDVEQEEPVEHLCGKCVDYAKDWIETADKLWAAHPYKQTMHLQLKNQLHEDHHLSYKQSHQINLLHAVSYIQFAPLKRLLHAYRPELLGHCPKLSQSHLFPELHESPYKIRPDVHQLHCLQSHRSDGSILSLILFRYTFAVSSGLPQVLPGR